MLRQAGAILICIVSVVMEPPVLGGDLLLSIFNIKAEAAAIVPVTELREPSLTAETIVISDFAPDIEKVDTFPRNVIGAQPHDCVRRYDIFPRVSPDWKISIPQVPSVAVLRADEPGNITCWQVPRITNADVTGNPILAIPCMRLLGGKKWSNPLGLNAQISALEDSSILDLSAPNAETYWPTDLSNAIMRDVLALAGAGHQEAPAA